MKKYIKPELKFIEIATELSILCASTKLKVSNDYIDEEVDFD